jgi:hypothetical protein
MKRQVDEVDFQLSLDSWDDVQMRSYPRYKSIYLALGLLKERDFQMGHSFERSRVYPSIDINTCS